MTTVRARGKSEKTYGRLVVVIAGLAFVTVCSLQANEPKSGSSSMLLALPMAETTATLTLAPATPSPATASPTRRTTVHVATPKNIPSKIRPIQSDRLGSDLVPRSPYAYSFLLGGVKRRDRPNGYRDYLYGILVAAHQLRRLGSLADMILWVEFHHSVPPEERVFPPNERDLLQTLNITVLRVPSLSDPDFYGLQMQKFRILGLTQYRRILHLDGDVFPLANLDSLFHATDTVPPILEENFVVLGPTDVANGGFFLLTPHRGDLERIQRILLRKEHRPFSPSMGWGHRQDDWTAEMTGEDGRLVQGTGWTFFAASADQGLLWYWVASVRGRFSRLARGDDLERWLPAETISPREGPASYKASVVKWPLPKPQDQAKCFNFCGQILRSQYEHFMGNGKPWTKRFKWRDITEANKLQDARTYWLFILRELNDRYQAGLDLDHLGKWKGAVSYQVEQREGGPFTNLLNK